MTRMVLNRREFIAASLVTAAGVGVLGYTVASPACWRATVLAKWLADTSQHYDAVLVNIEYGLTSRRIAALTTLAKSRGVTLYFPTELHRTRTSDSHQISACSLTSSCVLLLAEGMRVRGVVMYDATLCRWDCFTPANEPLALTRLGIARLIDTARRASS